MIENDVYPLWQAYVETEDIRIQSVSGPALRLFIDSLLRLTPETWHAWALDLARRVSDEGVETPIRLPLFREVLYPALSQGMLQERPGCARWLAHFEVLLVHIDIASLPTHLRTPPALLREAIRVDASDHIARKRLVIRLSRDLDYALPELPDFVLAASVDECDELIRLLAEFRTHVDYLHNTADFGELINDSQLHFTRYRDYLLAGSPSTGCPAFVALRGGTFE